MIVRLLRAVFSSWDRCASAPSHQPRPRKFHIERQTQIRFPTGVADLIDLWRSKRIPMPLAQPGAQPLIADPQQRRLAPRSIHSSLHRKHRRQQVVPNPLQAVDYGLNLLLVLMRYRMLNVGQFARHLADGDFALLLMLCDWMA